MSDLIVIPARYGSTRLPGKPLLLMGGQTLLSRVIALAHTASRMAGHCEVLVATDDTRIAQHAQQCGAHVALTPTGLTSGSDRAYAAAASLAHTPEIVINLQGDAPFTPPATVARLLETLRNTACDVATPVYQLDWQRLDRLRAHKTHTPFSGTTCVRAADGQALWFSKTILPALRHEHRLREESALSPVWQHMGLYGYRMEALAWFASAPPSPYEMLEGLEQLRFLEAGRRIATIAVEPPLHALSGIDTPEDLRLAEQALAQWGEPHLHVFE